MLRTVLIAVAALLISHEVHARQPPNPEWLDSYEAVTGCPNTDVFLAVLQQRVSQPLAAAFAGMRMGVDIRRAGGASSGSLVGQLQVTDSAGRTSVRTLQASSCAELVEALSLIGALSARTTLSARMSAAPLSAAPAAPDAAGAPRELQDPAVLDVAVAAPDQVRMGPAAFILTQNAAAPEFQLGGGLGLSVYWPSRKPWTPSLLVGGYRMHSDELPIGDTGVRARFDLQAARALGCLLGLSFRETWSLGPCVDFDLGRLRGSGGGSAVSRGAARAGLWASTGLGLRTELVPVGPLRISMLWGMVVPWTRHEFFFAPDTVAFRVPAFGWRGALSAAVAF